MKTITWTFTFPGGETCTATGSFKANLGHSTITYTGRKDLLRAAANGEGLPRMYEGMGFLSFEYHFDRSAFTGIRMAEDGGAWKMLEL